MEALKDIFVPYEIAQKLKEIGFDEECVAGYTKEGKLLIETDKFTHYNFVENLIIENFNFKDRVISAPTWEQVKKWFREKNYLSSVVFNFGSFYGFIEHTIKAEAFATDEDYASYEQAREALIYKLIEIYEKGK